MPITRKYTIYTEYDTNYLDYATVDCEEEEIDDIDGSLVEPYSDCGAKLVEFDLYSDDNYVANLVLLIGLNSSLVEDKEVWLNSLAYTGEYGITTLSRFIESEDEEIVDIMNSMDIEKSYVFIDSVIVNDSFRHKGVLKDIIENITDFCEIAGMPEADTILLGLPNDCNKDYTNREILKVVYSKMGFKYIDQRNKDMVKRIVE